MINNFLYPQFAIFSTKDMVNMLCLLTPAKSVAPNTRCVLAVVSTVASWVSGDNGVIFGNDTIAFTLGTIEPQHFLDPFNPLKTGHCWCYHTFRYQTFAIFFRASVCQLYGLSI